LTIIWQVFAPCQTTAHLNVGSYPVRLNSHSPTHESTLGRSRVDFSPSGGRSSQGGGLGGAHESTLGRSRVDFSPSGGRSPQGGGLGGRSQVNCRRVADSADLPTTFTRTLSGAADGRYMVLQYQAAYDNQALATETITAKQEADGSWKVAGYFIK